MSLLDIYSKDSTFYCRDVCTHMVTAVLFKIAKKWNHPRCAITDAWKRKMQDRHTLEFYPSTKKCETIKFESELMELENIKVSEVISNLENQTPYVLSQM